MLNILLRKLIPMKTKKLLLSFSGFSVVGIIVTLLSLLLIYIFIGILNTPLYISYVSIYLFSIFVSYLLNLKFVFKVKKSRNSIITYYLIYGSSLLIGLITLRIYKIFIPLEDLINTYMVIPVTLVWNFTMLSVFLKKEK